MNIVANAAADKQELLPDDGGLRRLHCYITILINDIPWIRISGRRFHSLS